MEAKVREVIGTHLLDESGRKLLATLADDDSLIENGLLDSMGMAQLTEKLEKELDVVFDPLDVSIENLESVDKIVALVKSKQ